MKRKYILVESCHYSSIYGNTDYYILDIENNTIVEYSGFANFNRANKWYEDYCENHKEDDTDE